MPETTVILVPAFILLILNGKLLTTASSEPLLFPHSVRWKLRSSSGCFRSFVSVTMDQCARECAARRQRCKSINYKRQYKLCELCTDTDEATLAQDVGSVTLLMDAALMDKATEPPCRHMTCSRYEKCVPGEGTGSAECQPSECEITDFIRNYFHGKTINAPINSVIRLGSNTCKDSRSPSCGIIECTSGATWSRNIGNKAIGRTTWQISTAFEGTANLAVDENESGEFWDGSCTHTGQSERPWWIVDLGSPQCVIEIHIKTRTDCCWERLRNVYVYVGDDPNKMTKSDFCARFEGPCSQGEQIRVVCCPIAWGRYVKLQADLRWFDLVGDDLSLSLCDVKVY